MRNNKVDRRSERTRQLLNRALIELMLERRYDEISVQDIIDRANVGRSTFYAHYLDKEDLLMSGFTRVLDMLNVHSQQRSEGQEQAMPNLTLFFQHVQEHYQLYKALVRGGGVDRLFKKSQQHMRRNIELHLAEMIPAGQTPAASPSVGMPPLPLVADYLAGAVLNMLTWWLDNEMPYAPEQMDALFKQLVRPGVEATLGIVLV